MTSLGLMPLDKKQAFQVGLWLEEVVCSYSRLEVRCGGMGVFLLLPEILDMYKYQIKANS